MAISRINNYHWSTNYVNLIICLSYRDPKLRSQYHLIHPPEPLIYIVRNESNSISHILNKKVVNANYFNIIFDEATNIGREV